MNKRFYTVLAMCLLFIGGVFAYNPPVGGENMFTLTSPNMLTGSSSVAGGAIRYVTPECITFNPAVTGGEQRIILDLANTVLTTFETGDKIGDALNLGMVFPTKWGVFTGVFHGVFSPFTAMNVGNTGTLRAGFAKDLSDTFYVGASLNIGYGYKTDWALHADLGVWQSLGTMGFLKDFRWGASIGGLGKTFNNDLIGLDGSTANWYPSWVKLRAGAAANLVQIENFVLGASLDFTLPRFLNLIMDLGLQMKIVDALYIRTGWTFNLREIMNEKYSLIPSVGISYKIKLNSKKESFMTKKGWQQSEIVPSWAIRPIYSGITALSGGATVWLGTKDTEGPTITLWGDHE